MTENSEKKNIALPLPFFLFQLWENQKTGKLLLNPGPYGRLFCLVNGELTPVKEYFPEKDFLDWLLEIKKIEAPLRLNRQLIGSENMKSVVAVLIEHGFLSAEEALQLTAEFLSSRLTDYFSLPEVRLSFEEEQFREEDIIIKGIFIPEVILRGFRKIFRLENLASFLPSEKELIFRQVPGYARKLNLKSPEFYLWNQLQSPKTFGHLLEQSWLGPTETKKALLALACLKLVEFNLNQGLLENDDRAGCLDLGKNLALFNEKSTFISRYLAKKLGPVAFSLIEKCYREIQEYLDPTFQNLEIRPDGSFEPRAMLKMSLNDLNLEAKKNLLQGFDEILTAELLLIKKNLGNKHEETVANHLRKI
ncbi:MAG: hypothetical protein PHQ25_07195 [Acidobacteriota bacterium]|nr:hypothetical protein [Acidobacteriota bacterium]MDW3229036.1 hypothetical protein [Acidobacteriota bacterium]